MTERDETSDSYTCKEAGHYWILNDKSLGICKKCGDQKQVAVGASSWQNRNFVLGKAVHRPTT